MVFLDMNKMRQASYKNISVEKINLLIGQVLHKPDDKKETMVLKAAR
jgi:hypothetical protein